MRSESIEAEMKRARRRFLADCGKFAVATPPAVSLLLAASKANYAVASSGGSSSGGSGGTAGNAPPLGGPQPQVAGTTNTGGTTDPSGTNPNPNPNTTGGSAAGQSCGNTFQALADNDKCFR